MSAPAKKKKPRKPYTITKPRESWGTEEHDRFVDAVQLYGRDWKRIGEYVKSKSVIQIRSHAQKYFQKMAKIGRHDLIPPPRPKRRAKKPAAKRASKRQKTAPEPSAPPRRSTRSREKTFETDDEEDAVPTTRSRSRSKTKAVKRENSAQEAKEEGREESAQETTKMWENGFPQSMQWELVERQQLQDLQEDQLSQAQLYLEQAMTGYSQRTGEMKGPEFAKVYDFLGSLFEPNASGHIEQLSQMNEADREIIQVLMHNLARNLSNHTDSSSASVSSRSSSVPASSSSAPRPPVPSIVTTSDYVKSGHQPQVSPRTLSPAITLGLHLYNTHVGPNEPPQPPHLSLLP